LAIRTVRTSSRRSLRRRIPFASALVDGLPIGQSSVSHHLAILRDAGIVTSERRGNWAFYSIVPDLRGRLRAALSEIRADSASTGAVLACPFHRREGDDRDFFEIIASP
jgi:DNA-binding transcriptional ArsR family regulator